MDIRSCTIAPRLRTTDGGEKHLFDYEVLQLRLRDGESSQYTSFHEDLSDGLEQIRRFMEGSFDPWEEETQTKMFDDGNTT